MPGADLSVLGGGHQRRQEQGNPEINSNSNRSPIIRGFHYERHAKCQNKKLNKDEMLIISVKVQENTWHKLSKR